MKYKIKISYQTGNSLESEDTTDYLELSWDDLTVAKENLNRIKEHYIMYKEIYDYSNKKSRGDLFKLNLDKDWFVNKPKLFCISSNQAINESDKDKVGNDNWEYRPDDFYAEYCLNLKADNGNNLQMTAFWCGHFERLYQAEIEVDSSDMKIVF